MVMAKIGNVLESRKHNRYKEKYIENELNHLSAD